MPDNSIAQIYRAALNYLHSYDFDDSELTVQFIIEYIFSKPYIQLLAHDVVASPHQKDMMFSMLDACLSGQPLAYVLGSADFNGRSYFIQPGVLIPRPETEELVAIAQSMIQVMFNQNIQPTVFECGIGSGVISCELALHFPTIAFHGWDMSPVAIETAEINVANLGITNLLIEHADFFAGFYSHYSNESFSILVSNPPYVSEFAYADLDYSVLEEPKAALVADKDGLAVIEQLIELAQATDSILICEIGFDQRSRLKQLFPELMLYFKRDLSGHDRFLIYFPKSSFLFHDLVDALHLFQ